MLTNSVAETAIKMQQLTSLLAGGGHAASAAGYLSVLAITSKRHWSLAEVARIKAKVCKSDICSIRLEHL